MYSENSCETLFFFFFFENKSTEEEKKILFRFQFSWEYFMFLRVVQVVVRIEN